LECCIEQPAGNCCLQAGGAARAGAFHHLLLVLLLVGWLLRSCWGQAEGTRPVGVSLLLLLLLFIV
jgi:hypothetical protein